MKIYLCGPAANALDNKSIIAMYNNAEKELKEQGHSVINIMTFGDWYHYQAAEQIPMRLSEMAKADRVYVLADWQSDRVAQVEIASAIIAEKEIVFAREAVKPRKIEFFIY